MVGKSEQDEDLELNWLAPYLHHLRAVALTRQSRLRWVMEVDEVLHRALLRWAPREKPPAAGKGLSDRQIASFSLACRNVLIDEVRAMARRRRLAEEARNLAGHSQGDAEAAFGRREFVESVLSRLNPSARMVLELRYFDNLSFEEIGRRMGKRADADR
jgi:RNA polymerase sigma factor (sigma-70 family)